MNIEIELPLIATPLSQNLSESEIEKIAERVVRILRSQVSGRIHDAILVGLIEADTTASAYGRKWTIKEYIDSLK